MRNPVQKRNISFGVTAVCGAAVLTGILLPKTVLGANANIGLIMGGLTLGVFALIFSLQLIFTTRAYNRLLAGEGLKAQWMVPPELWKEFVAYHALLAPMNPHYVNVLKLTPNPPAEGVEVILGERAVIVDGDFQSIPTFANECSFEALEIVPGPPMFINMHILTVTHSKHGTNRTYHAIRFPVPVEAAQDAADTVTWYVHRANEVAYQSRSLARRFPRPVRNISLILAILAGVACAIGFYCRNQPQLLDQNWALGLAVTGVLVTPAALFMAIVAHRAYKSQQKDAAAKAAAGEATPTTASHEQL